MISTASPGCEASLAAAHIVVSSSTSLLAAARGAAAATATAAVGAATFHPVLAPLGAAAALRVNGGARESAVHITRTQRRSGQRRATPIAASKKLPRAYSARVSEFAAAAEHALSDSCFSDESGPAVLSNLRDWRSCSSSQGPRQLQQQQQVAASAHEPWLFSMALQASML